jgi:CelD/BcsL family acetyltransferase involved in cellulose biosynthesis
MSVDPQTGVTFRVEPLPALAELEIAWREAESRHAGSFFTSWSWMGVWLTTLPPEVEPQLIRAIRSDATVALAIAVLRRARRHLVVDTLQLHFNATGNPDCDTITIEHNDFVGAPGLLPAFIEWFAASNCADEVIVSGVSPFGIRSAGGLLRSERWVPAFANDQLQVIGRDSLGVTLSRNARQQLSRSMRSLSRFGALCVEAAATSADALLWFDAMKVLHVKSWMRRGKRHAFALPYFERFHRALISSGAGEMLRIRAGDHVVGYLYNFRRGATIYAYQSGFADDNDVDRPGYVCHALAMEHYAGQGAATYDFLAGDNRLKRSFGPRRYSLCWAAYSRPTFLLRLEASLRAVRERLRRTAVEGSDDPRDVSAPA